MVLAMGLVRTGVWAGQPGESQPASSLPSPQAAADLVRKTVANELKATNDANRFMFRMRKQTSDGSQTRLYVQTNDATAAMLVAINDKSLTPEQRQAEEGRLQYLMKNPEELQRKQKQEKDDAERVGRIVRAMPEAFLYEYDGAEAGTARVGRSGDELVRLKFRPNPKYDPPSRVEQVLTGMKGYLLIDEPEKRIAKIDGSLYRDVGFGWGILGHLDRGGIFQVEQGAIADTGWAITRMSLDFTGKVLLFKSIVIKKTEVYSDFRPVGGRLSFAQGVELLRQEFKNYLSRGD